VWIVLGVVLAAGYALSFQLRRRIWRARQVSGTRPPGGYWWEGDGGEVVRFVAVTLLGAGLVVLAATRLPHRDAMGWTVVEAAALLALVVLLVHTRRAR
jgi:hypothetical protein